MAYAALANVNAVVGLYTSLFPSLVYVVFGTSKHINLGKFFIFYVHLKIKYLIFAIILFT